MPRKEPTSCGLLTYHDGAGGFFELNPDPPNADEASPYHVMVRGTGHIPISYLIFARDRDHAVARLMTGLRLMVEKYVFDPSRGVPLGVQRARSYLEEITSGDLKVYVESFDTARIACQVNWASNGGV